MIHPDTTLKFINDQIGYGVFATADTPLGTVTYAYDALDIILQPGDPCLNDPRYKHLIDKFSVIEPDGSLSICWDIAKYMNHCCHYNTMSTGYGFDIATRDIAAGDEITQDYGPFNMIEPMKLICRYSDCRDWVSIKDFDLMLDQWDTDIQRALTAFFRVPQPLMPFLEPETIEAVQNYRDTGENYISIARLKFDK